MKTTDYFKNTIQNYLEQRAAEDELFAPVYANPDKNIDDCITYILNTVKASGCNGFTDDEIYSMAIHYYDEPDIEVGKKMDMRVVVNHTVVLTSEEQAQARRDAIKKATDEAYSKMRQEKGKGKSTAKKADNTNVQTLF
jgi:ribosome-associated translation inhibitor RaiA